MNADKNNINTIPDEKDIPISAIVFSGKVKFWKLAKATFIFTAAPALILLMFYVNGQINYHQAIFLFSAIFFVALMFNYPYIADLQEITEYVFKLVENKNPSEPSLSFLNNVEELSSSIKRLNNSWQDKNDALRILLLEDEILINSLPNIVLMLDANFDLIQANQAARNTLGWSYSEIIGAVISDEKVKNLCKKVMESGEGANLKYEINEPYYYFFNIRAEKFPINSPNKIAIVLIMQNLTDERKNEKMLNDFVANASHELKTPLASITGFIETLAEVENDPEAEREFLKIMKEQSDRMNRLINDLLVLSLAESSTNRHSEKLNLALLLQETLMNLSKLSKTRNVDIKTVFENNLPDISGNRDEMLRLFDNLVSNAVKYSKEGEQVTVKFFTTDNSKNNFREFYTDQKLLCISVQDLGEGIDEKYIPRLTERFFRVDKARSRNLGGTGLGLSIVAQIVENHGGHLEIVSELGKGSTFSVYLPLD